MPGESSLVLLFHMSSILILSSFQGSEYEFGVSIGEGDTRGKRQIQGETSPLIENIFNVSQSVESMKAFIIGYI